MIRNFSLKNKLNVFIHYTLKINCEISICDNQNVSHAAL